ILAGREKTLARNSRRPVMIDDTVEELRGWSAFRPKTEENDAAHADRSMLEDEFEGVVADNDFFPADEGVSPSSRKYSAAPNYTQHPFERTDPRVGRNDLCPCGSGKKFKKCCGTAGGRK